MTSHYLNQWWLVYQCIYALLGLNELKICTNPLVMQIWVCNTSHFSWDLATVQSVKNIHAWHTWYEAPHKLCVIQGGHSWHPFINLLQKKNMMLCKEARWIFWHCAVTLWAMTDHIDSWWCLLMALTGGMMRTKTAHVFQQCIAIGGISLCVYVVSDSAKKTITHGNWHVCYQISYYLWYGSLVMH